MYKVVKFFNDLQDNGYAYHVGDTFPHDGITVDEKRIKELATENNRRHLILIEEVKETVDKTEDKPKRGRPRKEVN